MTELISELFNAIGLVQDSADRVKVNSRKSKNLSHRLRNLELALLGLDNCNKANGEGELVNDILAAVQDASALVQENCDEGWLKVLQEGVSRQALRDRFADINGKLDAYTQSIYQAINARLLPMRSNEEEDDRLDWEDLLIAYKDQCGSSTSSLAVPRPVDHEDSADEILQRQRTAAGSEQAYTELVRASVEINQPEEELGRGAFGKVVKAQWAGVEVAVKVLYDFGGLRMEEGRMKFREEVGLVSHLHHPHVIHVYGAVTIGSPCLLVMELLPLGSLASIIRERRSSGRCPPFALPDALSILLQVARAVAFLHSRGIMHRDLKAANVLCGRNDVGSLMVKVGLAKQETESSGLDERGGAGDVPWRAPEALSPEGQGPYNLKKADIYSFGILASEVLTGDSPYGGLSALQIITRVLIQQQRPALPSGLPNELSSLIKECWVTEPKERPTAERLLKRLQALHEKHRLAPDQRSQPATKTADHSKAAGSGIISGCVAKLTGHTGGVVCLTVAPDGTLYSGSNDRTIREWRGGQCVATMSGHEGSVECLALAPDGTLYSGSRDRTVQMWKYGCSVATLSGHLYRVTCLLLAPNDVLYSGSMDRTVRKWQDDCCTALLLGHTRGVEYLALGPDGTICSGACDGTVRQWRGEDCIATVSCQWVGVWSLVAAPDGTLYAGDSWGAIQQWKGEKWMGTIQGHIRGVACLAVAPDGTLVSGSWDKTIKQWKGGCCVATLSGHTDFVTSLALAPDGRLYSGSQDSTIREWR